ncbi:MAG: hypothetical protein U1F43_34405 [Myxococcota bacterium]
MLETTAARPSSDSAKSAKPAKTPVDLDLSKRLAVFFERGMLSVMPTTWQLLLGQIEMAPYVVMPDAGDVKRYEGALYGHPLIRTPIVISQIGLEHFRVGHGLHSSMEALERHIAYVYHEGMPVFDLQLVHTHPGGLERLRAFLQGIEDGATPEHVKHRRLASFIIPNAARYRRWFLEPGGWIDRAAAFDYPPPDTSAPFLRPEFTSLAAFVDYCARAFPAAPSDERWDKVALRLAGLATRRLREKGR